MICTCPVALHKSQISFSFLTCNMKMIIFTLQGSYAKKVFRIIWKHNKKQFRVFLLCRYCWIRSDRNCRYSAGVSIVRTNEGMAANGHLFWKCSRHPYKLQVITCWFFFPLESKDFHNNNPFDLVLVVSNSPPALGVVVWLRLDPRTGAT